jgi:hypothetical protein
MDPGRKETLLGRKMKTPANDGRTRTTSQDSASNIMIFQHGHSLLDEATAFEATWKVSEIVNPDGSITVRRKFVNPNGSKIVREEEYPHFHQYQEAKMLQNDSSDREYQSTETESCTSSNATPKASPSRPKHPHHRVTWDPSASKHQDDAASTDLSYLTSSECSPPARKGKSAHNAGRSSNKGTVQCCLKPTECDGFIFEREEKVDFRLRPRPVNPVSIEVDQHAHTTTRGGRGLTPISRSHDQGYKSSQYSFDPYESGLELSILTEISEHSNDSASAEQMKNSRTERIHTATSKSDDSLNLNPSIDNVNAHGSLHQFGKSFAQRKAKSYSHSQVFTVTVVKDDPKAKIGIHVGLKYFTSGPRLIVTRILPDGPFMNTPVECGDIILSVNGKDCIHHPNTAAVLGK